MTVRRVLSDRPAIQDKGAWQLSAVFSLAGLRVGHEGGVDQRRNVMAVPAGIEPALPPSEAESYSHLEKLTGQSNSGSLAMR